MKTLLTVMCLSAFTFRQAQKEPKANTEVTNNFLDLQAASLGDIFGDSLTGGNGTITNYLELVDKSGRPESEKKQLREAYLLYSKALDAQGKDSLQAALTQELLLKAKKDSLK